jgi:anaerobic selenocysteine-containing dehydrogenase
MIKKTFCRICPAVCGLAVNVEDDRIVSIKADRDNPLSQGYSCLKGRSWEALRTSPRRLTQCLQRDPQTGEFVAVAKQGALDGIAEKMRSIIAEHGPRAVAAYIGTGGQIQSIGLSFLEAWLKGLGSSMLYTSMQIDQPAKGVAAEWHGVWAAGPQQFSTADVIMLIGCNPIVSSMSWLGGPPPWYPTALKQARKRGVKVIAIDPRVSETAACADIHLQLKPGEDATLMAAITRVILHEELFDRSFCDEHVHGIAELKGAVELFTPEYAAERAGLSADQIVAAARLFAGGTRGQAISGTGPSFAPHANVAEYLILVLNTLCGRWVRPDDRVNPPSVLLPDMPVPAQALPEPLIPPVFRPSANAERSRIGSVRKVYGAMPTAVLADEILLPGPGQIKALFVIGGNPAASFPDQEKTLRALRELELLVCIDVNRSETAEYAHYVLPATHPLEREDLGWSHTFFSEYPFSVYTEPMVSPIGEAEEEWRYLVELSARLGTPIQLPGGALDPKNPPPNRIVNQMLWPASRVSIDEIASHPGGAMFDRFADVRAVAPLPEMKAYLQVGAVEAMVELRAVYAEVRGATATGFDFLLICRRAKNAVNSMHHELLNADARNPLYVHPDDLQHLGLNHGEIVRMRSEDGCVEAIVAADASMRRGVVSMYHSCGLPAAGRWNPAQGTAVARLISTDHHTDPITGMARQTAIPVSISRSIGA